MKTKSRLALILLIFFISILPVSFIAIVRHSQALISDNVDFDQEWTEDMTIDKNITIEAGVTLTVKKGITLTFNNGYGIQIDGNMIIAGTSKNPVILRKDAGSWNYSITVGAVGSLIMRNVDISGSGNGFFYAQKKSIINTAYADSYQGGINMRGGTLNAQNCNFHDNNVAINIAQGGIDKIIVNRSKFSNNKGLDVGFGYSNQSNAVDFRYNWWGSADGPLKTCDTSGNQISCFYNRLEGNIDFSNWLIVENFHDPVIIIPGVFGSQKEKGIWKIDPIFHVYDNLYDEFVASGYTPGKDLFIFPYEWRDSNVENAIKLRYKIAEIKTIANWPKVDVVAHSMGGLLAREYIESNAYQKDIDQLITIGTPNDGSPEIYPLWEAGESIGVVQTGMKKFLEQEMEESGYKSMFEYIRNRPIFSAKELLPDYEYLFDSDRKQPLIYPADYPVNTFLDNLNSPINVKKLINVEYTKIAGKVASDISTISQFNVIKVDMGDIWEHGYPLSFEIPILSGRGAVRSDGDGTVPLSSAKSIEIPSDNYLELNSFHTDLPTKAQKDVLEALTGVRPNSEVTDSLIKNMLQVFVHSPIDIQIISPSGKRVGKDFDHEGKIFNEIEGAYYTGFDSENEFITIPNPEDGEYRILIQGTGNGEYRVEATKISEDLVDSSKVTESTAIINGIATINKAEELKVEVKENAVTDKNAQVVVPDPPVIPPIIPPIITPVIPPIIPPALPALPALPVVSSVINQTQSIASVQAVSNGKSSGHSKKKKTHKKKTKKTKKSRISKVATQVKKGIGISSNKNIKQKNFITQSWKYVAQKSITVWSNVTKAANTFKNFILKPFSIFKR